MTDFPTRRLKFVCKEPLKYGANAAAQFDDPNWPRFVRITDITEHGQLKEDTFRSLPPEAAEDYLLEEGDILLARSGSIGRSFIYKPEWGKACFAGYLVRARPCKEFDPRFVYWSLNALNYWSWIESIAIRSTIQNVSAERYAEYAVPAPSLDVQRRIVRFLDKKTARIDGLIKKKHRLLERLAEQRQAVITRAVTKGVNPESPMKSSGFKLLGDIPAHWELKRLKFVSAKIGSGITPRGGASVYVEKGVMLLRSQNVHFGRLVLDDIVFIDDETDNEMSETRVLLGDVLLNITGASIGRVCSYDQLDACANVNQHVCIIRPTDFVAKFVEMVLASSVGQTQIDLSQNGASREGLNFGDLGNFIVPAPPAHEQRVIARLVQAKVDEIGEQSSKVRQSIGTLEEYRSALINAAVTGQIKALC